MSAMSVPDPSSPSVSGTGSENVEASAHQGDAVHCELAPVPDSCQRGQPQLPMGAPLPLDHLFLLVGAGADAAHRTSNVAERNEASLMQVRGQITELVKTCADNARRQYEAADTNQMAMLEARREIVDLVKASAKSSRRHSEVAERNEAALLEARRLIADVLKLLHEKKSAFSRGTIQNAYDSLFASSSLKSAINLPIVSWDQFKAAVRVVLTTQVTRLDAGALAGSDVRPPQGALPMYSRSLSGKRKEPEPAATLPTIPEHTLDYVLTAQATRIVSWLVDGVDQKQLAECWIRMDGYPVVEISGEMLRSVATGQVDFDRSMCDAASRVLNHVEAYRVRAGNDSVPGRVCLSPTFVLHCLGKTNTSLTVPEMLTEEAIGFDILSSSEFIALVPRDQGWSCYSWDVDKLRFTVLDPIGYGKTDEEVQQKHEAPARRLRDCLLPELKRLRHAKVGEGRWSHFVHTRLGARCWPNNTGVFSVVRARAVDCKTGSVCVDDFGMMNCTRDVIYTLLKHLDNKFFFCQTCQGLIFCQLLVSATCYLR